MSRDALEELREAMERYDPEAAERAVRKVLKQGVSPIVAFRVLTDIMRELGRGSRGWRSFLWILCWQQML